MSIEPSFKFFMSKTIISILGSGRSGTSVISKALKTFGFDLGNNLMLPSDPWNPKGFWEDVDVVAINDEILKIFECTLYSLSIDDAIIKKNEINLLKLKESAKILLQKRFEKTDFWVFKDPRVARLLPLWQKQFKELKIDDKYIIALRNPLSSAQSFNSLAGKDIENCLYLWLNTLISSFLYTKNKKRIVVSYELLMENPLKQLKRLQNFLDVQYVPQQKNIDEFINSFLDKKLVRHPKNLGDLKRDFAGHELCIDLYENLLKLANDEWDSHDPRFLEKFDEIHKSYIKMFPLFGYIDSLIKKNEKMTQEMAQERAHLLHLNNSLSSEKHHLIHENNEFKQKIRLITLNGLLHFPMKIVYRILKKSILFLKKKS